MAEFNEPLSDRELDVLSQVVQGAANKEIAQALIISPNTVKVHLRNIYTKLGVSSRTEASIAAVERGLVTLSGDIPPQPLEDEESDEAPLRDGPQEFAGRTSQEGVRAAAGVEGIDSPEALDRPPAGVHLWPIVAIAAVLIAGVSLAWPWLTGSNVVIAPESTATPFVETQIADTRWFETRPMPKAREGMVMAAVGIDLYQIGGETADGALTGEVAIFDTATRLWGVGAAKPTPVVEAGGATLFGEIYVIGGRLADGRPTAAAEAYSPALDLWRQVAALPQPLWGGLVLSEGGYLYHLGGMNGERVVADSYVYDPSANGWRVLPPLPAPRAYAAGGVLEGQLYVVGGSDGQSEARECQVFDPKSEAWSACTPLTEPRSQAGAAVVLNKLYVIGGQTPANYGELYDPKTDVWQIINMPMFARSGEANWPLLGVANVETRIYAFGGRLGDNGPTTTAFVYAPLVYQMFLPSAPGGVPVEEP